MPLFWVAHIIHKDFFEELVTIASLQSNLIRKFASKNSYCMMIEAHNKESICDFNKLKSNARSKSLALPAQALEWQLRAHIWLFFSLFSQISIPPLQIHIYMISRMKNFVYFLVMYRSVNNNILKTKKKIDMLLLLNCWCFEQLLMYCTCLYDEILSSSSLQLKNWLPSPHRSHRGGSV